MKACYRCHAPLRECISINAHGVCSYCELMGEHQDMVSRIGHLQERLSEKIQRRQGISSYDCLVGFSGGKDSSYILYRLKFFYNVKVLAYTLDNGFLTEHAKKNIASLIQRLDIDHLWVKPPRTLLKEIYTNNLNSEAWPCSACFHMMEASAWKMAYEMRIPFIISGRTPEQILRKPDRATIQTLDALIAGTVDACGQESLHKSAQVALDRINVVKRWLLPDGRRWSLAHDSLYLKDGFTFPADFAPEFIPFFLFEEHDEKGIIKELVEKTNWLSPETFESLSHFDCLAHDAASFLFYKTHGTTILMEEVRSLLRMNKLAEEEADNLINKEQGSWKRIPFHSVLALSSVSGLGVLRLLFLPSMKKIGNLLYRLLRNGQRSINLLNG